MAVSATPQTPERAPISFGAWLGIVLLFLFFGIFVLVLVAIAPHGNTYEAKRAEAREKKLNDARNAATQELNSYAWVDKGKGIARIPIDRAMELTLRDLASKKPAPANPIETPAQAPASGASPAPAVSPAPAAAAGTPKPTSVEGPNSENRNQPAAAGNPPGAHTRDPAGPGCDTAASLPQADNLQFRPCLNKSRPALPFLLPERRRHDFLRMNPTEIPLKSPGSVTDLSIGEVEQVERALIDASTRVPVLMFYASAIVWLLLGTLLAGFTSFKLHSPDLLSNVAFLTWGRIRPAHLNVMLYGWASMAGMGTAIWLMARLCRTTLRHPLCSLPAAGFGISVSFLESAEFWPATAPAMNGSNFPPMPRGLFLLPTRSIVSWAVLMFRFRRGDHDLHHAMVSARRVSLVPVDLLARRKSCFSSCRCRA